MTEKNEDKRPNGFLMLRTMSMPKDANPNGFIFGGWLMSQIDTAAAMMAFELCQGMVATVAVKEITFNHPVTIGDVVCCYCRCTHIGNTSVTIHLELWARKNSDERINRQLITETDLTYVAIAKDGSKRPLPESLIKDKEIIEKIGYLPNID